MLVFLKTFLEYFSGLFSEFAIHSLVIPNDDKASLFQNGLDFNENSRKVSGKINPNI